MNTMNDYVIPYWDILTEEYVEIMLGFDHMYLCLINVMDKFVV